MLSVSDAESRYARVLGLPLREPVSAWLAVLALFAYFVATLARDLSLYDSGELALAAVQLGLGHPPGQPLHTLLGFVLSHLPGMPALVGVALASAVPASLTILPATSLAQTLLGPSATRLSLRAIPWLLAMSACHVCLWEPASRVEVYALTSFFAVWAVARIATAEADDPRAVFAAAFALGLAASANPMIALCTGLALAPGIVTRVALKRLSPRALRLGIACGLCGLLPYAYVIFAARRTDVMVWGAPRELASLVHYLTLADYQHNQTITLPVWIAHAFAWLRWALGHWLGPVLALGVAGHLKLGPNSPLGRSAHLLLLSLLVMVISFNVVWNLDVPDYNGYLATALWVLGAGAAAFCGYAVDNGQLLTGGTLAMSVLLASALSSPPLYARTRHHDHLARALAEQVLSEAPANAIVISEADHFAGSFFYLQEAEQARPDVTVLAYGLCSSRWHWEHVYRLHPQLAPITLQGPGGRAGRVARLLAQNPGRAVLVERAAIAAELGLRVCPGGLYLRTGAACDTPAADGGKVAQRLHGLLELLGNGSPGADQALAATSYNAGESLWRVGAPRAGFELLLSGVPSRLLPTTISAPAALDALPVLAAPPIVWQRGAALGDPARNLFLAAIMLSSAHLDIEADVLLRAAATDNLPEAQAMLIKH